MKEIPEPFPAPTEASIVRAAAGWAHCVAVTGKIDLLCLVGVMKEILKCYDTERRVQL